MLRKFFSLPILGRRSVSKTFTSSDPRNEFPIFGDGDFELRLSQKPEDRFVLHSECLIANSPYFKACMSDRWAISEKPTGIIKWRYELRFDEEFEFGLLERISTVPGTGLDAPEVDANTVCNVQSGVPAADFDTEELQPVIEAHRQYLRILYEQPFNIFDDMEDPPVCSINCLLIVADTYGSLHVVMPKIQLYIKHLKMSGVAPLLAECPRDLLDLAINLRRRWLFKEVVCRLMADPTRDDEEICRIFEGHESLTLVLEKRKELRSTMKQVDDNLLTLLPTPPLFSRSNSLAKALGVAKFREDMAKRMKMWWYEKQWKDYPSKYREILEISKEGPPPIFDGFINDIDGISATSNITTDATAVYQRCYEVAARTITPLLHTFVREYPGKKTVKPRKQDMNEGFTCIGVFDEDLPWEYKTLWEVL